MKTLLQNPVTHLFLKKIGEWTLDPDQAMNFKDLSEAIRFQISHHLTEAQVFLKLDWRTTDESIAVQG
jgi:hypothetical protein